MGSLTSFVFHTRFEPLIQFNAGIIAGIDGVRNPGDLSDFRFPFFRNGWMDGWMDGCFFSGEPFFCWEGFV